MAPNLDDLLLLCYLLFPFFALIQMLDKIREKYREKRGSLVTVIDDSS